MAILRSRAGSFAIVPLVGVFAWGCSSSTTGNGASDASADHSLPDGGGGESAADTSTVDSGETANVLIADQFNNRVIEVTRQGDIVWSFGDGTSVPGPHSVVAPNDVERLPNGQTLIPGSGAGPGTEATCPEDGGGCLDNRVIIVDDATREIVWQYGEDGGVSGNGPNQLSTPVAAVLVPGTGGGMDHILITDQGNNRIIEVTKDKNKDIVWQFPPVPSHAPGDAGSGDASDAADAGTADAADTGMADVADTGIVDAAEASVADAADGATEASVKDAGDASAEEESGTEDAGDGGTSDLALSSPNSAERLANGDTLIADESNNRVIEVTTDGKILWQYPKTLGPASLALLNVAGFASRLTNPMDHTLITDTSNNRVIEVVDSTFKISWEYSTANRNPNNPMPNPSCAVRLKSGNTLITDQFNHQVIEVTPESKVVWQYGQIGVAGAGKGQLNTPYHAVDIGDYTGLTDPSP